MKFKMSDNVIIGETKRKLIERFGEHRRSILNRHQLSNPTPVSLQFNQPGHSINDVHLIPLELIHSNRDSVRKAHEAHLIIKAHTLHPFGINRRDEARDESQQPIIEIRHHSSVCLCGIANFYCIHYSLVPRRTSFSTALNLFRTVRHLYSFNYEALLYTLQLWVIF